MAALGVFTFMSTWNNFLTPLIFINSKELFTLPLIILSFQNAYITDWNLTLAAATVAVIPVIFIYIFAQRYFVEGVVLSGIKG